MVVVDLDGDLSVTVERGEETPYRYRVSYDGEERIEYGTSADIRTSAGKVGLRNIIARRIDDYEKARVETLLTEAIRRNEAAIGTVLDASGPS